MVFKAQYDKNPMAHGTKRHFDFFQSRKGTFSNFNGKSLGPYLIIPGLLDKPFCTSISMNGSFHF